MTKQYIYMHCETLNIGAFDTGTWKIISCSHVKVSILLDITIHFLIFKTGNVDSLHNRVIWEKMIYVSNTLNICAVFPNIFPNKFCIFLNELSHRDQPE